MTTILTSALRVLSFVLALGLGMTALDVVAHPAHIDAAGSGHQPVVAQPDHHQDSEATAIFMMYHGEPHDVGDHDHAQELVHQTVTPTETIRVARAPLRTRLRAPAPPFFELNIPPRV